MADFLARLAARALGQATVLQPLQVPSAAPSPAAAQLPGDWESVVEVEAGAPSPVTPASRPSLDRAREASRPHWASSLQPRSETSGAPIPAEAAAVYPSPAPPPVGVTAPASPVHDAAPAPAPAPAAGLPPSAELPRRTPELGAPRGATPVPPVASGTLFGPAAVQPLQAAPPLPPLRRLATPRAEAAPLADPPLELAALPNPPPPVRRTMNPPPQPVSAVPVGRALTPALRPVPGTPVGETAAPALVPRRETGGLGAVPPPEAPADRPPPRLAPSPGIATLPAAGQAQSRMLTGRLPTSHNQGESPAPADMAALVDGSNVAGPHSDLPPGPPASRRRGPAQEGPATIRVTIGRVEVRAAPPPASPPPAATRNPPRPRRPVLTLAEYLQRRSPAADGRRPSGEGR
jgi:hypothetical protein